MLSITPALICVLNKNCSLNLINPAELYAFAHETNAYSLF